MECWLFTLLYSMLYYEISLNFGNNYVDSVVGSILRLGWRDRQAR
jgi:hypothetical protein